MPETPIRKTSPVRLWGLERELYIYAKSCAVLEDIPVGEWVGRLIEKEREAKK